jgi:hypothetical protein
MQRDLPLTIAEWPRNARESIRVSLGEFNGTQTVDIRVWFAAPGEQLRPGRAGITLGMRHLPQIADALMRALAEAERRGILPGAQNASP